MIAASTQPLQCSQSAFATPARPDAIQSRPLSSSGWEVKLEQAGEITRHVYYHDWHRVERALALFQLEVSNLTEHGWQPDSLPDVELSPSTGR